MISVLIRSLDSVAGAQPGEREGGGTQVPELDALLCRLCANCVAGWALQGLRGMMRSLMMRPVPVSLTHGQHPTGAAHLEMVQHLLPGQEQQSLFADLPGDLGVEEGVLPAAVRHSFGEEDKNQNG